MHLQTQVPHTSGKIWSKKDSDLLEEDQVMEHFNRPDIHKWAGAHRSEDGQTLEKVHLGLSKISIIGSTQNPIAHDPEQSSLV
ncbi:hypothetical protein DUI87_05923 [Hirundo rustica rustica]|uniref:Uncharacterized protein n=1 Tax=Hirundo rustica rustica TaxID=333673 RepID=A0A3M0KVL0_HIRRU|nr:hypothetical protein DUI87_05923 [Hirundo rustica rustica]